MIQNITIDPANPFGWLEPDFFHGGTGGGGGGTFSPPLIFNLLEGFTHSVQGDQYGNQKHLVKDALGNIVTAAASAHAIQDSTGLYTGKFRSAGQLSENKTWTIDTTTCPPAGGGPWNLTEGNVVAAAHQNGVGNASFPDQQGRGCSATYAYHGAGSAAATFALGDGSTHTWKASVPGGAVSPDLQLDIWEILGLMLAIIACVTIGVLVWWAVAIMWLIGFGMIVWGIYHY